MNQVLKKPGDFTVFEGHGYPLVLYNESKHNKLPLVSKANKTKHPTKKKRGQKGTRWKDPSLDKRRIFQRGRTAK